jgi:hypothetical protein
MVIMKKYILLLLVVTLAFSCKKSKGDSEDDCNINCFIYQTQFNFRLVDKVTGQDLVFGANPRYTTSDVQVFFDAAGTLPMNGMQADAATKSFRTTFAKTTMYLKVVGTTYKLDVTFRENGCCSSIVETLKVDGVSLCSHCNEVIGIPDN